MIWGAIVGANIGLLFVAFQALIKGRLKLSKNCIVEGTAARLIGLIGFLPLPVSGAIAIFMVAVLNTQGRPTDWDSIFWPVTLIQFGVLLVCALFLSSLALIFGHAPRSDE